MSEDFGPTFITVTDEDGKELVLEFVDALEYNGQMYQAFFPAETEGENEDDPDNGLVILKVIHEDGEDLLSTLDSDEELEADLKEGRIECPVCGDPCVAKRPSAPNFVRVQGTTRTDVAADVAARGWERAREMQADAMKVLREAAAMAEDVGERFPETVRDIHDGRAERRLVKGTCSGEEAQALHEEGIPVMPLPDAVSRRLN